MAHTARTLPKIGDEFNGGKFRGILTDANGEPYVLSTFALSTKRGDWGTQMAWAKEHDCDLASPLEAQLLHLVAPEDFQDDWIWLNKPEGSDYAWDCYSSGYQCYYDRSSHGGAVAVRRSPLGSFDPFESAQRRTAEDVARLKKSAQTLLEVCDAVGVL